MGPSSHILEAYQIQYLSTHFFATPEVLMVGLDGQHPRIQALTGRRFGDPKLRT